jgi:Asp-tRNA(Asn)/Glu-tRNA(Gln) amidotransferase C subunit
VADDAACLSGRRGAQLRPDVVTEGGPRAGEALLTHAARREQAYFTVPRVMDE